MSEYTQVSGRFQQTIPAVALLGLGLWVGFTSFTVEDPQPYLFPQLIAVTLVLLGTMALVRALRGANRTGVGFTQDQVIKVSPAAVLMLATVFIALPVLGFYAGSALGFFAMFSIYDPEPHTSPKVWLKRIVITAGFMSLVYVVFNLLLQVQTPRGLLI